MGSKISVVGLEVISSPASEIRSEGEAMEHSHVCARARARTVAYYRPTKGLATASLLRGSGFAEAEATEAAVVPS